MAPKDKKEFKAMIKFAATLESPVAIRYPRGTCFDLSEEKCMAIEMAKSETINNGEGVAIIALGKMMEVSYEVVNELKEKNINITLINARFAKPLDRELLLEAANNHHTIITVEDNSIIGGFGSYVNDLLVNNEIKCKVVNIGIPDEFIEHGNVDILYKQLKMDKESIKELVLENIKDK